jgi:hypothetical protein
MAAVSRKFSPPRNQLLSAMSVTDLALLRPHLKPIEMAVFKEMERPNRPIDTVYFMEAGIASVVAVQPDETKVEVGLIGREGMSGIAVVLGGEQSPHSTYIQVAVEGLHGADGAHRHCKCSITHRPAFGALDFDGP